MNEVAEECLDAEIAQSQEALPAPRLNLSIKDFELLNVLGDGSVSTVLHVRLKQTGEESALKVMDKIFLSRHKKVHDAIQERNVMDRLQGGFTARLKFTFQDDDKIYMGMELFLNGDLFAQMEKRYPMPLADIRFYAGEMVLILEHLRKHHVISRDLKPENLLLTDTGHLVLSDFGCAKILTEAAEHPAREQAGGPGSGQESKRVGSFKGTADYIAPEILSGTECSYSIDLWSFGCVIYQMIVNKPPFRARSEYLIMQRIIEGELQFPDDFPSEARDLVAALLVLDPSSRLGASDLDGLKEHPFFEGIDWDRLRDSDAPAWVKPDRSRTFDADLWEMFALQAGP